MAKKKRIETKEKEMPTTVYFESGEKSSVKSRIGGSTDLPNFYDQMKGRLHVPSAKA